MINMTSAAEANDMGCLKGKSIFFVSLKGLFLNELGGSYRSKRKETIKNLEKKKEPERGT